MVSCVRVVARRRGVEAEALMWGPRYFSMSKILGGRRTPIHESLQFCPKSLSTVLNSRCNGRYGHESIASPKILAR